MKSKAILITIMLGALLLSSCDEMYYTSTTNNSARSNSNSTNGQGNWTRSSVSNNNGGSSNGGSTRVMVNDISSERTFLSGYIFQTLSKGAALVRVKTSEYRSSVVKIVTDSEVYYDDKEIKGVFVRIGTYTYETMKETTKTVPVYIRESEYKPEYKNLYQ